MSGLCKTDNDFFTQLWDQMVQQAGDALNLLIPFRSDPTDQHT